MVSMWTFAQCDLNNFTLTPINGSCAQDMAVRVNVPGADCSSVTATIRRQNTTVDLASQPINSGTTLFEGLVAGTYEVVLKQNVTTTPIKLVTVSTTYNPITINTVAYATTCNNSPMDDQFTNNGRIDVTFGGGVGNYEVVITGPTSVPNYTSAVAGSRSYTNLSPGNYTVTVFSRSGGCESSESRSVTIQTTNFTKMAYGLTRRLVGTDCNFIMQFEVNEGNRNTARLPGNATYMIEGDPTVYNMTPFNLNTTGRYAFRTGPVPENKNITMTVTDGCNTVTKTLNTFTKTPIWQTRDLKLTTDQSCNSVFSFQYTIWQYDAANLYYRFSTSSNTKVDYYAELPRGSGNYQLLQSDYYNQNFNLTTDWVEFQTQHTGTNIKIVVRDQNTNCITYERTVNGADAVSNNNLEKIVLQEVSGVLEGTSTISLTKSGAANWSSTDSFSYPLTFTIARKDGQTAMTINPTQPYSLAGVYTLNFPYVKTYSTPPVDFWTTNRPMFGDLPPGAYVVKVRDACGYEVTREITLTKPAGYNPTITYNVGCLNSDINYNMNPNANTQNQAQVYLYSNNNGAPGTEIRTFNTNQITQGTFTNVPPGNYFIVFRRINYYPKLTSNPILDVSTTYNNSVARNISGSDQTYHVPVTVSPYEQVNFTMNSVFCNPSDNTSGILDIRATGVPVGFITYSVWPSSADPNTANPLRTYTTTNLSEMSHIFNNLSQGSYIVRVITACGYSTNTVTLSLSNTPTPTPVSVPGTVCKGATATLSISLSNALYDINWYNSANTLVGSGSDVPIVANQSEVFTVRYSLKPSLGCSNPTVSTNTASLTVIEPFTIIRQAASCNPDGTYKLTVIVNRPGTYTVTGNGGAGTWTGQSWTSDNIPATTPYNITITTTGGCSPINLTGNSPGCYCFRPALTTGTSLPANHGITTLGRAGSDNENWPMVRTGAWTVLESKTKGFVINRIPTTAALLAIPNPVEGMMVYDTQANCLKIFTTKDGGTTYGWYCLASQACPD